MEQTLFQMNFSSHGACVALSKLLRGKLCESLSSRLGRIVEAGKSVYDIGDSARSIYFLRNGIIRTGIVSESEDELTVQVVKPGEIFGELCFCHDRRQEQAIAMERSDIVEIPFEDLVSSLQQNRELMLAFLESVSKHLSEAYHQSFQLAVDGTMKRLVGVLLKLAREFGYSSDKGIEIGHYIKQEELANMIAARREVTSGLLNRLREMGLIEYSRKGRLIIHIADLQKYSDVSE